MLLAAKVWEYHENTGGKGRKMRPQWRVNCHSVIYHLSKMNQKWLPQTRPFLIACVCFWFPGDLTFGGWCTWYLPTISVVRRWWQSTTRWPSPTVLTTFCSWQHQTTACTWVLHFVNGKVGTWKTAIKYTDLFRKSSVMSKLSICITYLSDRMVGSS